MRPATQWEQNKLIDIVLNLNDTRWMYEAACIGAPSEWFFPAHTHEDGHNRGPDAYRPARQVCQGCPVKLPCLGFALESGIRFGMWGGMSPDERRKVRRRVA